MSVFQNCTLMYLRMTKNNSDKYLGMAKQSLVDFHLSCSGTRTIKRISQANNKILKISEKSLSFQRNQILSKIPKKRVPTLHPQQLHPRGFSVAISPPYKFTPDKFTPATSLPLQVHPQYKFTPITSSPPIQVHFKQVHPHYKFTPKQVLPHYKLTPKQDQPKYKITPAHGCHFLSLFPFLLNGCSS